MKPLSFLRLLRLTLVCTLALGLLAPAALADYGLPDAGATAGGGAAAGGDASAAGAAGSAGAGSAYDTSAGYVPLAPGPVSPVPPAANYQAAATAQGATNFAFDTPDAIKNFKLSVGDTFAVNIWGTDLRISQTYTIPFEGRIYVPQIGEIPVNGLTTTQIRDRLSQILAKRHPGLHVSVLLVAARPIAVFLTGLVAHPGIVAVPALSRLSSVLGGVLPEGSLRHIVINRADRKKPLSIDFMRFEIYGNLLGDPLLKSGDIINIVPIKDRATLMGEVYNPLTYEFLPGETLKDLITMAHGLKPHAALSQASVVNDKSLVRADRVAHLIDLSKPGALDRKLKDEDVYDIPRDTMASFRLPRTHVTVVGAVARPGTYTLTLGTRLRDALNMVGGVQPGAGLREVRIYHKAPAGGARFAHPIIEDAYKLLYDNDESQDIELHNGDLVLVPASKDLASDSAVYVYGQVGKPGKEAYRAGYRLSDYLNSAGGTLEKADLRHVTVTRGTDNETFTVDAYRIMRQGKFDKDPVLHPGDVVNVPEDFFYVANFSDLAGLITTVGTVITAGLAVWTIVRAAVPSPSATPIK